MVYKWNEISIEMFKEIFTSFWKGEDVSKGKVLEIQNLPAIKSECEDIRIYFGGDIKLYDWKEYNKVHIMLLENMTERMGIPLSEIIGEEKFSMCMLNETKPKITPLGLPDHFDLIWSTCFGGKIKDNVKQFVKIPLNLWYIKDKNGTKTCDVSEDAGPRYSDTEKYVRIRSIDFEDWKEMISKHAEGLGELKWMEDDIVADDINVIGSINLPSEEAQDPYM